MDDEKEYMKRDKPKKPPQSEVFGEKRMRYGYVSKYAKTIMHRDLSDRLRNEELYIEGIDDAERRG